MMMTASPRRLREIQHSAHTRTVAQHGYARRMVITPGRDSDERRDAMRLTKDVRRQLLEQNEGFSTRTSYSGRNSSEDRTYTVTGGELHVNASGNTSWADSRYTSDFVADEEQTHRYLYDNLGLLDKDGVIEAKAVKSKQPSESVASPDGLAEDDAHDDDDSDLTDEQLADPTSGASDRLVVAGVLVLVVGGLAIERRRAKRSQRRAAAASERKLTETRDGVPEDEG